MLKVLNRTDRIIWACSVFAIVLTFLLSKSFFLPTLIVSIIGLTSLIYTAKCHVFGLVLMLFFSVIYGFISFYQAYYGEMVTYMGMTAPMTAISIVAWLKNPAEKGKQEVKIEAISNVKWVIAIVTSIIVTIIFYFILRFFNNSYLILSTLSVFTSFLAVTLTFLRSQFYALAYALNDIVLIILWSLATIGDSSYLTMVICFVVFLINDIYGFCSWQRMKKIQRERIKKGDC